MLRELKLQGVNIKQIV